MLVHGERCIIQLIFQRFTTARITLTGQTDHGCLLSGSAIQRWMQALALDRDWHGAVARVGLGLKPSLAGVAMVLSGIQPLLASEATYEAP